MTVTFPKMKEVQVRTTNAMNDLLQELTATVENHLQFVDDPTTETRWGDLVCNGLTSVKPITLPVFAQILDITDEETATQMVSMIQILFDAIPILKSYWQLTRVNLKSVYVKRLNIDNAKKVLKQLSKTSDGTATVTKKVQATLTQSDFVTSSRNSVQETPSKTKPDRKSTLDLKTPTSTSKADSTVDGLIQVSLDKFDAESPTKILTRNNMDTEEGFEQPKRTVPFATVNRNYPQSFSQLSATSNTNSFANLVDDVATEVVKDNEEHTKQVEEKNLSLQEDESGVSYDDSSKQSSSGAKKMTDDDQQNHVVHLSKECYDTIVEIVGAQQQDKLSEEVLTQWIESKVVHVMERRIVNPNKVLEKARHQMDQYLEVDFKKMKKLLKSCQTECEIGAMRTIRSDTDNIYDEFNKVKYNMQKQYDDFKDRMNDRVLEHQQHLKDVRADFQDQCKEYLKDHILHRRELFTNQKATFDNDMRAMKQEMDQYVQLMKQTKTDLEQKVYSIRASIDIYKAELQDLKEINVTMAEASFTPQHYATPTPKVNNIPPEVMDTPVNANINTNLPINADSISTPTKPFARYTKVMVHGNGIRITEGTVMGHYFKRNELWYDVATSKSTYSFIATEVSLYQEPNNTDNNTDNSTN